MDDDLEAPPWWNVMLTRSEAARFVGASGESTIRAAEAKGLEATHDPEGQVWHCPFALDAWKWRNPRPSKAQRDRIIREAAKARALETREQDRRLALHSEREVAEWDAEHAKSETHRQAEEALRQSVQRRNEEARLAFEMVHMDERTAGAALGFKSYEARYRLRDLVNRALLRRLEGPREVRVEWSLDGARAVETQWPLCRGGPFYPRDEVLALRREASTIADDSTTKGLARGPGRAPDDALAELLRFVLGASR